MAAIVRVSLASKISLLNSRIFRSSSFHSSSIGNAILINMPSLSPTMTSGVIVNWNKKPGDVINPGDVLCEIQTDKAVMAFELEEEGTLAKIMGPDDGKECNVGVPIAILAEPGEEWQTVASTYKVEDKESNNKSPASNMTESYDEAKTTETPLKVSKALGPATRNLLQRYGLNTSQVPATGPKGLLVKGDVLDYIRKQNLTPISFAPVESRQKSIKVPKPAPKRSKPTSSVSDETLYQDINLSSSEIETADKLLSSKVSIAHSYGSIECCTDQIRTLCEQYHTEGIQVSTIDVVAKAVSAALVLYPEMCAMKLNEKVVLPSLVNLSVASTSEDGLHISNIVDSPSRGIEEIGSMIRNRSNSCEDVQGSFMVLNLGNSGVESCKTVISAPQCSALTVGAEQLALDDDANISATIIISLSFDGEAIPVETASRFLKVLKGFLESPTTIVLGEDTWASDTEIATY